MTTTIETPAPDAAHMLKDVKQTVGDALQNPEVAGMLAMHENAVATRNRPVVTGELREVMEVAYVFAASGFFSDAKTVAQAAVKIMIGRSLGLSDIAALSNIYLFEANRRTVVIVGVHLLAAKIKTSDRYRFKIIESTANVCRIEFYENGFLDVDGWAVIATEQFSIEEAKLAELTDKDNWKKNPQDMLYARTMARGFRRHCSELLAITPYVREEFQSSDLQPIVDITPLKVQQQPRRASEAAATASVVVPDVDGVGDQRPDDDVIDAEVADDDPPNDDTQTVSATAPAPAKRRAGIYVEEVIPGKKGKDFELWKVRFSDGVLRATLNATIRETAERAIKQDAPVSFEMGIGQYGSEITVLEILS